MDENNLNNSLNELNQAEEDVLRLMEVAEETIHELERIPTCDYNKIDNLSKEYLNNLQSIRSKIMNHSHLVNSNTLLSTSSSSNQISSSTSSSSIISYTMNNYSLKKEVEILKSFQNLQKEDK
jgi:hypothetical protein